MISIRPSGSALGDASGVVGGANSSAAGVVAAGCESPATTSTRTKRGFVSATAPSAPHSSRCRQVLPPSIEQAAADAVLAGHHDRRYPWLQTLCRNLALLLRCPTASALATRDHLDAPIASTRTIGRRSVLRSQRHCHHPVVLPQGRQVARFSSRRAMCRRDIAYGNAALRPPA